MSKKELIMLIISILLGYILIIQSRAFSQVGDLIARETNTNVFQQIKVMKAKNQDLNDEVKKLEDNFEKLKDQNSALSVIESEINDYQKLNGKKSIFGEGVIISFDKNIGAEWMVDLVNELFNAGAEAVAINGVRYKNDTAGFDTLPNGSIFYGGIILSEPFVFSVIGEPETLIDILNLPGGILPRINNANQNLKIGLSSQEIIQMSGSEVEELGVDEE